MEKKIIVVAKEIPENWCSASETRALVASAKNKVISDLMDEAMKTIQEKAKNGATYCCVAKDCEASIADAFMEILTTLGYTVSQEWYRGYVFTIRW